MEQKHKEKTFSRNSPRKISEFAWRAGEFSPLSSGERRAGKFPIFGNSPIKLSTGDFHLKNSMVLN